VDALARLRHDPASTALFLDFDGTLAPIVVDAAAARPLPGSAEVLTALARRYAVVAVVSGRPVSFLRAHLPPAVEWHGLYGLESAIAGNAVVHPAAAAWRDVIDAVAADARAAGLAGLDVEHKGLSLTVHHRRHPEVAASALTWATAAAARSGLELRTAKMSLELHPPIAVDKGTVVASRAAGMSAAGFVGDDVGDLPAFAALDALAAQGVATVKVAVRTPETAAALLAQADLAVDGPDGALALLRALLEEER
jgi:trehalose 6-phosphate phosphatase